MQTDQKKQQRTILFISIGVVVFFLSLSALALKVLLSGDGDQRQRHIQRVTLVQPPPPMVEPPPPEPEEMQEEIIEPEPEEAPLEEPLDALDAPPPGEHLGLDAEGGDGADAFGLLGNKGGRALIGGDGDRTLMQRYAWYTRLLQDEISKRINDHMRRNGGIPPGDHKVLVQVMLDPQGRIVDYRLQGSSGSPAMDQALAETLTAARVSEAPPADMPRSIQLRISSRG